jgi:hypothetical protein
MARANVLAATLLRRRLLHFDFAFLSASSVSL